MESRTTITRRKEKGKSDRNGMKKNEKGEANKLSYC